MKYPQLVPERMCKTAVTVVLTGENTPEGEFSEEQTLNLKCYLQTTVKNIRKEEYYQKQAVTELYFNGPLAETDSRLQGYVIIGREKKIITFAFMARNPDGTVNYTKIEAL